MKFMNESDVDRLINMIRWGFWGAFIYLVIEKLYHMLQ